MVLPLRSVFYIFYHLLFNINKHLPFHFNLNQCLNYPLPEQVYLSGDKLPGLNHIWPKLILRIRFNAKLMFTPVVWLNQSKTCSVNTADSL